MVIAGGNETFRPCDVILRVDDKEISQVTHSLMAWEDAFNAGNQVLFYRPVDQGLLLAEQMAAIFSNIQEQYGRFANVDFEPLVESALVLAGLLPH